MAGSLTLVIVGIALLTGGDWNVIYAIACLVVGGAWWHASEHARRARLETLASGTALLAHARKALAAIAAALEVAAVLLIGGFAFDRPEFGLFGGFSAGALLGACFGVVLLFAASRLNALKLRVREETLTAWLRATTR